jgi:hypothetical protein
MGPRRGGRTAAAAGRGGRSAGHGKGNSGADSNDEAPAWRQGPRATGSAKSKKQYLQWKRQVRSEAREDDDSSDEGGEQQQGRQPQQRAAARPGLVRRPGSGGDDDGESSSSSGSSGSRISSGDVSDSEGFRASEDEDEEGSSEGDSSGGGGAAEDAGGKTATQPARAADVAAAREHAADARNMPPSTADMEAPLVYKPLVDVAPPGDLFTPSAGSSSKPPTSLGEAGGGGGGGGSDGPAPPERMARITEAEVGWTEEGRCLGMPMRPAWQVGWGVHIRERRWESRPLIA